MGVFKGKYSSVEEAHCLDVNRLVAKLKQAILKEYGDLDADKTREEVGNNLKTFVLEKQSFSFTSAANKLGGKRWMVFCPKCGKRVIKLYKPESSGAAHKYYCRECHHLKSPSALYGSTKRYKEIVKPVRRMERIKEILQNKSLSENLTKELLDEYDGLDAQIKNSTFYRKISLLRSTGN